MLISRLIVIYFAEKSKPKCAKVTLIDQSFLKRCGTMLPNFNGLKFIKNLAYIIILLNIFVIWKSKCDNFSHLFCVKVSEKEDTLQ